MNRDAMIEALARAIHCHDGILPAPWDNAGDQWEAVWAAQRGIAESQAAAVLDLCGPKPLVWEQPCADFHRANVLRGCYEVYGVDVDWWAMLMVNGTGYCISRNNATPDLAKAAAQDHAVVAHWANTPLAYLIGGAA